MIEHTAARVGISTNWASQTEGTESIGTESAVETENTEGEKVKKWRQIWLISVNSQSKDVAQHSLQLYSNDWESHSPYLDDVTSWVTDWSTKFQKIWIIRNEWNKSYNFLNYLLCRNTRVDNYWHSSIVLDISVRSQSKDCWQWSRTANDEFSPLSRICL